MKVCTKCRVPKKELEFGNDRSAPDGLDCWCKGCRQIQREERRDKARLSSRNWAKRNYVVNHDLLIEEMRVIRSDGSINWKRRNRKRLNNAVRDGRWPRASTQICVDCGEQAEEWDHYQGYGPEMTFVVEPVCRHCHKLRHQQRNAS